MKPKLASSTEPRPLKASFALGLAFATILAVPKSIAGQEAQDMSLSAIYDSNSARFVEIGKNALRIAQEICDSQPAVALGDKVETCKLIGLVANHLSRAKIFPIYAGSSTPSPLQLGKEAGNDGKATIVFDFDGWEGKLLSFDSASIGQSRWDVVLLTLHEAAVLAELESNDQYNFSISIVRLLNRYSVDVHALVGLPLGSPIRRSRTRDISGNTCAEARNSLETYFRTLGFNPSNNSECRIENCKVWPPAMGLYPRVSGFCQKTVNHQLK